MINTREQKRIYRHNRIRAKVVGTTERPRLCIHRSLSNISVALIDDSAQKTLISMSTLNKDLRKKLKSGGNVEAASVLGEAFAAKVLEKGIKKVCFDRGGCLYHGRVKALADAVRKGGVEF
ncbi:MAG TPA: 50S ribosomal protein L18 [Candidatus Omnitrophota bacterium]|nr:50S ribosomal protein L18 [Candidatus Omnitrophota bacterium]HQL42043.1 50S ribosomal protein L18 [Candidatus Omnitrophota bacterium]